MAFDSPVIDDSSDGPSFFRRFALGIITVVGCYFGLLHLINGVALTTPGSSTLSAEGTLGLLMAAILTGATAAGTINRRAELTGLLLGLATACGFFGLESTQGNLPLASWWIGVAASLGVVGVVGGFAGRLMMPPAPDLPIVWQFDSHKIEAVFEFRFPIVWWRIVWGVAIVLVGTTYTETIQYMLSKAHFGKGSSLISGKFIAWQISLLIAVLGGIASGANTRAGLKQGLITGFFAGAGAIVFLTRFVPKPSLVLEFWFDQLNVGEAGLELFAAAGGSVWCMVAVGGWLGGHLLPPR